MVNLSDVAAMGGRAARRRRRRLGRGRGRRRTRFSTACAPRPRAYGVPIVGGHTNLHNARDSIWRSPCSGAPGARLLTSFDAEPGDVLIIVVDRRGAYREPFDNFQAALEAPPERLRADLALLPELAETRSRARRQGHQPGRRSRHGGHAGRKLRRVDRARSRRHRAAAGRRARALAQDLSELWLSPVRRAWARRARACDVSRARAACGFDRRLSKPGSQVTLAFGGPARSSARLRAPSGCMGFGAGAQAA